MSMDRANYLRMPDDFPMNAVVSAIAGAQHNIGGGTALALLPSLIQAFGISSDQYLKLEATVDGEIVLTNCKHVLCDMIEQCDLKAPPPVDLAVWWVDALRKRFFDFSAGQADVQFSGQFQPKCPRLQTSGVLAKRAHMERSRQPFFLIDRLFRSHRLGPTISAAWMLSSTRRVAIGLWGQTYIFLWREMEVAVSIHFLVRRSHNKRPKVVTYV